MSFGGTYELWRTAQNLLTEMDWLEEARKNWTAAEIRNASNKTLGNIIAARGNSDEIGKAAIRERLRRLAQELNSKDKATRDAAHKRHRRLTSGQASTATLKSGHIGTAKPKAKVPASSQVPAKPAYELKYDFQMKPQLPATTKSDAGAVSTRQRPQRTPMPRRPGESEEAVQSGKEQFLGWQFHPEIRKLNRQRTLDYAKFERDNRDTHPQVKEQGLKQLDQKWQSLGFEPTDNGDPSVTDADIAKA